eukprot:NODE_964_length_1290_cov_3.369231.p2 GENE.NODE_964_length_1290_cov_3.369231~~NODE_964_length_1290_cov_3.369231.p2  ORF type:complete len:158 (-),score=21.55 NODE_964_length_1290_cov_3.369231:214-687(-)
MEAGSWRSTSDRWDSCNRRCAGTTSTASCSSVSAMALAGTLSAATAQPLSIDSRHGTVLEYVISYNVVMALMCTALLTFLAILGIAMLAPHLGRRTRTTLRRVQPAIRVRNVATQSQLTHTAVCGAANPRMMPVDHFRGYVEPEAPRWIVPSHTHDE